jgi:hypothetical protein
MGAKLARLLRLGVIHAALHKQLGNRPDGPGAFG